MFVHLDDVPEKEIVAGFHGRFVHSGAMTVAHWRADAGAALPLHDHPQEMIVNLLEGELELTVDGETKVMRPGDVAVIPGGVPHQAVARTACRILDVWNPPRDDYR